MSTKYPQGLITPTPPFKSTTAKSFSGVWTLEQLAKNFYYYTQAVPKSLRIRSSASAYLNRTPASTGNRQTMTFSMWVKRGELNSSGYGYLIDGGAWTSGGEAPIMFYNDTIQIENYNGSSNVFTLITTQVFRDPSAWYHIVVAVDTTQAVDSNRIKLYVNGVQVTSFSTASYPSQNLNTGWNTTATSAIGRWQGGASRYFDGYMAEINFIDGQALDPSYFGQISPITGVWSPAAYVGSYGTNGFYLKFSDTTSTTTLCYDYSGNGNNWTPNNISLTSGSTYDSMLDSPTNYDNGGTGVGNYCVISPLSGTSGSAVTNGNLTVTGSSSSGDSRYGSFGVSSGKWYWEHTVTNVGTSGVLAGISSDNNQTSALTGVLGYYINGNKYNGSTPSAYGASFTTGDVIGVAFDADAGTLTFYKNNTSQGVAFTGITGTYYPLSRGSNGGTATVSDHNFGQRPFAYTPPTGFKALNTQNLPAASIVNGAQYMAATLWTGNSSSQSIVNAVNGTSFQPDMVWVKSRTNPAQGYYHLISDSVRGVSSGYYSTLYSNTTEAENTYPGSTYGGVTTLNSNGFTLAPSGSNYFGNASGYTYVGWQWKAGGTAVTNTAGSITSQVSANTTAGFSVATFTSQSSGSGTFGHGLGIAPSMVILKTRGVTSDWYVYHASLPSAAYYLWLDSTAAQASSVNAWNSTAPSSSVVTLGSAWAASYTMVAYCFAAIPGYSAFGSYTGNGSSDGPFVFLGFRPRWIMVKGSTVAGTYWAIYDTSRNTYNVMNSTLAAQASDAEYSYVSFDAVANGFKIRNTGGDVNTNGQTYIYAAFAENPFKYSLAR